MSFAFDTEENACGLRLYETYDFVITPKEFSTFLPGFDGHIDGIKFTLVENGFRVQGCPSREMTWEGKYIITNSLQRTIYFKVVQIADPDTLTINVPNANGAPILDNTFCLGGIGLPFFYPSVAYARTPVITSLKVNDSDYYESTGKVNTTGYKEGTGIVNGLTFSLTDNNFTGTWNDAQIVLIVKYTLKPAPDEKTITCTLMRKSERDPHARDPKEENETSLTANRDDVDPPEISMTLILIICGAVLLVAILAILTYDFILSRSGRTF